MNDASLTALVISLIVLILLSAFFSASETAMMRINRYRLRHQVKSGRRGARRVQALLKRPDRLIGIILLGNNFVNILASSITTIIALHYLGEAWIAAAAGVLTLVILVFAEVAPKTLAAGNPEKIAYPGSLVLTPLLWLFYPAVWVINFIANGLLRLTGLRLDESDMHLSSEELRVVVNEAGPMIPKRHQKMLINILDLEKVSVEDIMIPRNEIIGIDIDDDMADIMALLTRGQYSHLPIYHDDVNNVVGILDTLQVLPLLAKDALDREALINSADQPYFVPEGTPLNTQLLKFQREKRRIALIVDEYGEVEGLVSLEDILEEIVGEFSSDYNLVISDIHPQEDGSYLVDGGANVRELNRTMHWHLPVDGPKTLNGLILESLEDIPDGATSTRIAGYIVEIVQSSESAIKVARIVPPPDRPR
jgi:Mg2+/Co2+ transporter CorB